MFVLGRLLRKLDQHMQWISIDIINILTVLWVSKNGQNRFRKPYRRGNQSVITHGYQVRTGHQTRFQTHYLQLSPNMASKLKVGLNCIKHCWGVCEQNSIVNSAHEDDWTAELAIIDSNAMIQPKETNSSYQ